LLQNVLVISAATFAFTVKSISVALIPVLVAGIQSALVLGLKGLFPPHRRASTGFLGRAQECGERRQVEVSCPCSR